MIVSTPLKKPGTFTVTDGQYTYDYTCATRAVWTKHYGYATRMLNNVHTLHIIPENFPLSWQSYLDIRHVSVDPLRAVESWVWNQAPIQNVDSTDPIQIYHVRGYDTEDGALWMTISWRSTHFACTINWDTKWYVDNVMPVQLDAVEMDSTVDWYTEASSLLSYTRQWGQWLSGVHPQIAGDWAWLDSLFNAYQDSKMKSMVERYMTTQAPHGVMSWADFIQIPISNQECEVLL